MEVFTESHSSLLLSKEWLVKVDNTNSIPYLFKFGICKEGSTCCVLITDTKTVWAEIITAKQLLRRWLQLNPTISIDNSDGSIAQLLRLISLVHTVGGISDANFDIVDSRDADLAFELDRDEFKWRWDTYLLGPKTSSEIISKHLIMPLVSLAHISFYSADPVSELDEEDLEKTVDKIGRTARRSVDIHVKHTFARPRIATTLQRVSSLFGFAPLLSPIKSEAEAPNFLEELSALHAHGDLPISSAPDSGKNSKRGDHIEQIERVQMPVEDKTSTKPPVAPHQEENAESVTESDEDDAFAQSKLEPKIVGARSRPASGSPEASVVPLHHRTSEISAPRPPSHPPTSAGHSDLDSDSPPPRKMLKAWPVRADNSGSSSDSDAGARGRSQNSQGASMGGRGTTRGVRQPIRRGAKRF